MTVFAEGDVVVHARHGVGIVIGEDGEEHLRISLLYTRRPTYRSVKHEDLTPHVPNQRTPAPCF